MTFFIFSLLLLFIGYLAGLLGALTGLGGGILLTPALVLLFHIDIYYAMGASLICAIATSSGAAAAYLREGYTNLRIGMFLETAAVVGAIMGAYLIVMLPKTLIALLFSAILFLSAYLTLRKNAETLPTDSHPMAHTLNLTGNFPTANGRQFYHVKNVPLGFALMGISGLFSGLLGIGSGALKVLAMDYAMRLPYKVATTTSNFMIGITASASAGLFFAHGFIQPVITFPVLLGVVLGSYTGAKFLPKIHNTVLRWIFSCAITFLGLQMVYKALLGTL